ncbi:Cytochrome P450 [Mycena chlorophos]|uniref:Cytochrome P450 n=1 Tax=Mycena chlorophos TaxID=658473 RepID=A0A8H6W560_MYCCL|nr:Cytochrome P450 [Mycena chlorophos]
MSAFGYQLAASLAIAHALLFLGHIVPFLRDPYQLRKYPGPFLAKFSYGWNLWAGLTGRRTQIIHEAHQKYGSVVRISPSEISFSNPAAYEEIHSFSAKLAKSNFYDSFASQAIALRSLFATRSKTDHGQKRKMLHSLFTAEVSRDFAAPTISIASLLLEEWDSRYVCESQDRPVSFDCVPWITFLSFDLVGVFAFGSSFQMLQSQSDLVDAPVDWKAAIEQLGNVGPSLQKYPLHRISLGNTIAERETQNYFVGLTPPHWRGLMRRILRGPVHASLEYSGFVAEKVLQRIRTAASDQDRDLIGRFMAKAEAQASLLSCILLSSKEPVQANALTAELLTILVAGSDTSRNTLLAAIYYIAHDPSVQQKLQTELDLHLQTSNPAVESLPYLGACLDETLRLFSATHMGLPRTVPEGGLVVRGLPLVSGTTVGVPIYTIHRDKDIWGVDAEEFQPARWLKAGDDQRAPLAIAFKPFSDGPASCIGKSLALLQLRLLLALIFQRYEIRLEEADKPLAVEDWFVRRITSLRISVRRRGVA